MDTKRAIMGLALGGMILGVVGCGQKLTYERWRTVSIGAPTDAVEEALGQPWEREGNTWIYHDKSRQVTSTAIFTADGRLMKATWISPDIQDTKMDNAMLMSEAHGDLLPENGSEP